MLSIVCEYQQAQLVCIKMGGRNDHGLKFFLRGFFFKIFPKFRSMPCQGFLIISLKTSSDVLSMGHLLTV